MRQITDFLLKRGGHRLQTFSNVETSTNSIIHAWGVRGRIVMIHEYAGDNGFKVYTPAAEGENSIPRTLDALRAYVGQDDRAATANEPS
jgi:hypothetical protein